MITTSQVAQIEDPTPELVQARLTELEMTAETAAALLRIHPRTMQRYVQPAESKGATPIPFGHYAILALLASPSAMRHDYHAELARVLAEES